MTYLIAAAGTGGHVYPGLAVGEALVDMGVRKDDVLFVGGDRLEATVYPEAGFPFLQTVVRGLQRSASLKTLTLPRVVWKARTTILEEIRRRGTRVALGMGGYVSVPTGMSAASAGISFMVAEQNAEAGLANRVASRWARRQFVSFPETRGLEQGEWVGNPVRRRLAHFDRGELHEDGMRRYELESSVPVLGVYGGSLGARALNEAVASLVVDWVGEHFQIVHLTGRAHIEDLKRQHAGERVTWRLVDFEDRMDLFYAASDLVVARAGGGVAELTATKTPAILVPGEFGSTGHQAANAAFLESSGAVVVVQQEVLEGLAATVRRLLFDATELTSMRRAAEEIARPLAAETIASAMIEAAT
jgi:UDP-N-acetylglucosamine--N-acetylmuramyl-(pentapeptide) pyrophosphoryl-undecaprenol N-acetylglucosamine transferase